MMNDSNSLYRAHSLTLPEVILVLQLKQLVLTLISEAAGVKHAIRLFTYSTGPGVFSVLQ